MATFPVKRNPLNLALENLDAAGRNLADDIFPVSKTVPLDKDIGIVGSLDYIQTLPRMRLSTILLSIDAALTSLREDAEWSFYAEQSNRIAADEDLQNQLNAEIANRTADVNEEEARARAAEELETSNRIIADSWLSNALESDRSPLRLQFQGNLTYQVGSGTVDQVYGLDNQVTNQIAIASGVYQTDFSGSVINFSAPSIVYNPGPLGTPANGTFDLPSLAGQNNKWIKASVVLLPTAPDTISITFAGSFGTTQATAPAPTVTGGVPIGVIAFQVNSGGNGFVQGSQGNVTQFKDLSPEDSSGSSESPLDPSDAQSFLYYTRSDFAVDRKNFLASTTGVDQILGLGKILLNAGQQVVSKDLTGSMIRDDAATVGHAQAILLYSSNKVDPNPTVEMTADGGNSWSANSDVVIAQGNHLVVDFTFPHTQALFTAGAPSGAVLSNQGVAAIIRPSYRSVVTNFQAYLRTTATTGTARGRLFKVSSGIPSTLVASASEVYLAGQDILSTPSYKSFTFAPVTLEANTDYALVVEGTSLNSSLSWEQVTTASSTSISSAVYNGSGWSANAAKLASVVYGSGLDVRLKITSSINGAELLGFGVNMVLDNQAGYAGEKSWEVRTLTATEAQTGLITLSSVRYTPGAHQLHANAGGHDFMAPDFVEVSASSIQFPSGFLQEGDLVKFYVSYGIVDGSSVALQKVNTLYEAVVGNAAQVAAGVATYTSIQTAINSVAAGGKITLLQGTFTENLTIGKEVCIHGKGRSSIIDGTVTFTSAGTGSMLKFTKILDNVTINLAAQAVNVSDNWLASGKTVSGGTNCFILNIGEN